jgi:hypothetical protein
MAEAEAQIARSHKRGSGTDRLINAARLSVLEKNLGIPIKRHRNPDMIASTPDQGIEKQDKEEVIFLGRE